MLRCTFRTNVFPMVCPSSSLTPRPAIRVSRCRERPPMMVMSVTGKGSENERAQSIKRPLLARKSNGSRAVFGKVRGVGERGFTKIGRYISGFRHHPAHLFRGLSARFPAPQVNEQLAGQGYNGPFSSSNVGFRIQQDGLPFLDQVILGLIE